MDTPLVSVLMPVFNTAVFLPAAIQSVLAEHYRNFELLICDDASADNSLAIARDFERTDSRVRVFARSQNSGRVSVVYDFLAGQARGRYLIASDSDDVALPHRLETLVAAAERRPDTSAVYGIVHAVSTNLRKVRRVYDQPFCPYCLFRENYIPDGGALIRRTAFEAAAGYDATITWGEDYDLRLRLALEGPMILVNQTVYLYRQHGRSWTATQLNPHEECDFKQQVLERESARVSRFLRNECETYRDAVAGLYHLAANRRELPGPRPTYINRGLNKIGRLLAPLPAPLSSRRLRGGLERAGHIFERGWIRLRRNRPTISPGNLAHALRGTGVGKGDTIIVHCSLSALGWVQGGPTGVISILQDLIGTTGRILMPTFTYACDLGAAKPNAPPSPAQRYRPNTPCAREMGVVAETFRSSPGVHRIHHPGISFAIWGREAEAFAARHFQFDSFSSNSPVGEIYRQGKAVLIGTDFETLTLLHLAEYQAGVPYQNYHHYYGTADPTSPVVRLRTTGASAAFRKLTGLLQTGLVSSQTVSLGTAHVTAIKGRELVDVTTGLLRFFPDLLLGNSTATCRDRRAFFEAGDSPGTAPNG